MSVSTSNEPVSIGLAHELIIALTKRGVDRFMISSLAENQFQSAEFVANILQDPKQYFKKVLADVRGVDIPPITHDMLLSEIIADRSRWQYWVGTIEDGHLESLEEIGQIFTAILDMAIERDWTLAWVPRDGKREYLVDCTLPFRGERLQDRPGITNEMVRKFSEWQSFHF